MTLLASARRRVPMASDENRRSIEAGVTGDLSGCRITRAACASTVEESDLTFFPELLEVRTAIG